MDDDLHILQHEHSPKPPPRTTPHEPETRTITIHLSCQHGAIEGPETAVSEVEIEASYEGDVHDHPDVREAMLDAAWDHADIWATEGKMP